MQVNKVVILAYDALDPFLVERFRLSNLKQEYNGIVDNRSFPLLFTPIIWASFITGLPPRLHGVGRSKKWKIPMFEYVSPLLEKAPRFVKTLAVLKNRIGIVSHIEKPYDKQHYQKKKIKTIFDYAENPYCFDIPSYNESELALKLRSYIIKVLDKKIDIKYYEQLVRKYHYIKSRLLLKAIMQKKYDLLMVHFELSDALGHFFISNSLKMLSIYTLLDKLTYRIKKILPKDSLLLVVSDHGMKPFQLYKNYKGKYGDHSPYGFWSSNLYLKLPKNVTMIDFFNPIVKFILS